MTTRAYIKTIYLENFLCHDKSTITLDPKYNLIVGPNGSGKSAILNALDFISGNNPKRYTRRNKNFKEGKSNRKGWGKFIQYEKNEATVSITVPTPKNELLIEKSVKIDKRGENRFYYRINQKKSSQTSVVKQLAKLGINLRNPFNIIHQTSITGLVKNLSPNSITEVIETVSGIYDMKQKCYRSYKKINKIADNISILLRKQRETGWRIDKLKKEVDKLKKIDHIQVKMNELKYQEIWVVLDQLRKRNEGLKRSEQEIENEIKSISMIIQDISKKNLNISNQINVIDTLNKDADEKLELLHDIIDSYNTEIRNRRSTIIQKIPDLKIQIELDSLEPFLKGLKEKIPQIQKELKEIDGKINEMNVNESLLEDYKDIKDSVDDSKKFIENYIKNIKSESLLNKTNKLIDIKASNLTLSIEEEKTEDIQAIISAIEDANQANENKKDNITKLHLGLSVKIANLENELLKLNNEITAFSPEEITLSFPKDVRIISNVIKDDNIDAIGPLCSHITFKSPEYEAAARFVIPDKVWYSFLTFSKEARDILRKYKFHSGRIIRVLNQSSIKSVQNLPSVGIGRLIEGITAEPLVKAYLYSKMWDIIVARDQSEADHLMELSFSSITLRGVLCRPYKNFEEEEQRRKSKVPFTRADIEEILKIKEKEVTLKQDEIKKESKQLFSFLNEIKRIDERTNSLKKLQIYLQYILNQIITHNPITERFNTLSPIISSWQITCQEKTNKKDELTTIKETITLVESILKLRYENDTIALKVTKNEKMLTKIKSEIENRSKNLLKLKLELSNNEDEIESNLTWKDQLSKKSTQNQISLHSIQSQINKYSKTTLLKPLKNESLDSIRREYQKQKQKIHLLGNPDTKSESVLSREQKAYNRIKTQLSKEESNKTRLINKINESTQEWIKKFTLIINQLNEAIGQVLKGQDYNVTLRFDERGKNIKIFEESFVKIDVSRPLMEDSVEIDGLSGGEKSMVAMAIILGMQSIDQESTVRLLDEFDQSLDLKNKEFVREKIVEASTKIQYIVLSPGHSSILGVDARITKIRKLKGEAAEIKQGWNPPLEREIPIKG